MSPKAVLLVDDHPVVALGIKLALQESETLSLVATLTNPSDVLSAVERLTPDVVVLDLAFDGAVRLALIRQTRAALPEAILAVFSSLPAKLYRQDCLAAGADVYLTKDNDLDVLVSVLEELCSRSRPAARPQGADAGDRKAPSQRAFLEAGAKLTPREYEIAALLSRGLSVAEIAPIVSASENTVAVHRDNLRLKLGCRDSVELVARLARIYAASERND